MAANLPAHTTGISQIWLINLDRRKDRFERFMQRHPEMSGRINRLPAYDGKSLKLTPKLARLFLPNNFEWHKPTMGCAMSHLALWYGLASEPNDNASYLILEDDALLDPSWVAMVEKAFLAGSVPADWEVLFLGGILPKYRETFEKSVRPLNRMVGRVDSDYVFGSNPRGYFHFCAYAYLLNKRGAKRLLDLVEGGNGVWMQADFFACYTTPELSPPRSVYFFHPLLAQSFQDSEEGYAKPYADESDETTRVDSDIWKEGDKFSADEIGSCLRPDEPLDIPGALGLPAITRPARAENNSEVATVDKASPVKKAGLVCVTWNSAEKLKVTLESIAKHTDPATYDLCVVDNASTDDTAAICSGTWPANFKFVRSEKNLGWVGAINSRLPEMRGYAYVGFLNDDIEVGPGWLQFLVGILDRHKDVGAVGPLASNDRDWQGYDRFRTGPSRPGLPELTGIKRDDVVAMSQAMASFNPGVTVNDCVLAFFCILIRSEVIAKIGGLDDAFNDLYLGDDDDYCQRIVEAGYLLALSFNSYVAHRSGSRSLSVVDYEERYSRAQKIIAAKHGGAIGSRAASEFEQPEAESPSSDMLISISLLHATRGRPEQAVDARKLWLERANKPERVEHIFAIDHDDESSESLKKFYHVIQTHDGYSVGAWNLAARHSTGHILIQMSDDWDPPAGWDDLIAGCLDVSLERVLWVNEDYTRKDIMCMAILTRKYYEKYGLFDPRFKNVYSDDDFTAKAKNRSAITYANNIVFKHKHFTTGDSPVDATYQRCNDHNEYHGAKVLFDSIHNATAMVGSDTFIKENQVFSDQLDTTRESRNRAPEQGADYSLPIVSKAHHADWPGRFREVISDPLNILIRKHPLAGVVSGNDVYLHTGLKVPLSGPLSYYSEFSQILALNRGIHEPLEEFVFQQVIPWLPQKPAMLELGAYWAHYSMWLLANRPEASVCMVEPDETGLKAGIHNFKTNGFKGEFIHAFVQTGGFEVDRHMQAKGLGHLDILHADIQGYELQMLQGARNALERKQIDYVFVSTHSQELHEQVCHLLAGLGYRVEVEADFDSETTSMDGFVFATSPIVSPVFRSFKPLGRVAITDSKPDAVFEYLEEVRSCINPVVASSHPFLREFSGVIHVGANTGQERHIYSAYGLSVLWVEPIPEVFAALEANIQGIAGQAAINALLAEADGKEYDLNIANNGGASSSILEFKQHKELWPEVNYVGKVRCQSATLPTLLEKAGIQAGQYDALVLDTQGSELLVLRGASSLLQSFRFIKVEVPDFESYEGCCRDSDVSAFMAEHGFEEVWRSGFAGRSGTGSYFDVVYKKRS